MKKILVTLLLVAVGVALLFFSSKLKKQLNDPNLLKVQATITDIVLEGSGDDSSHTVYVEYELDGTTQRAQLDCYTSKMRIGDAQEVLVDAGNPTYVILNSPTSSRIMLAVGIFCIVCGVLSLLPKRRVA